MIMMIGIIEGPTPKYRLLNTTKKETKDVNESKLIKALQSAFQPLKVVNLMLAGNRVVGKDYTISNYGVVGKKQVPVIISVGILNGKIVGFTVSDSNGKIKKYTVKEMFRLVEVRGLANGKLKKKDNRVVAIEGNYQREVWTQNDINKTAAVVDKMEETKEELPF